MTVPLVAFVLFVLSPLSTSSVWEALSFRGIPANGVTFGQDGLSIRVQRSAGPLVWPLPSPLRVERLRVSGAVAGQLNTTPDRQGSKGADDFVLRVGLVEAGITRPSFMQRRLAPAWLRRLFALAPPGQGIDKIRFFNLGLHDSQMGWQREHPLNALVTEQVVTVPDADGRFAFDVDTGGIQTLAIWLSADGDDTQSSFTVRVERLELAP
jgi:hypothetical protein